MSVKTITRNFKLNTRILACIFLLAIWFTMIGCSSSGGNDDPIPSDCKLSDEDVDAVSKLSEEENRYDDMIMAIAGKTVDFRAQEEFQPYQLGMFLQSGRVIHTPQTIENLRQKGDFSDKDFEFRVDVRDTFASEPNGLKILSVIRVSQGMAVNVHESSTIQYKLKLREVELDYIGNPGDYVLEEGENARQANEVVFGEYKAKLEYRIKVFNQTNCAADQDNSLLYGLIDLGKTENVHFDKNTMEYIVTSDEPVAFGYLIKKIAPRPRAHIFEPVDQNAYEKGGTIVFSGEGHDSADSPIDGGNLVWISNIDGQIGTGSYFTADDLSEGRHTINLTAFEDSGAVGIDSVSITVNPSGETLPEATIETPSHKSEFRVNDAIVFSGNASDSEDGNLTGESLRWYSNLDGLIGTGGYFSTQGLSAGIHAITFLCVDSAYGVSSDTVELILHPEGNSLPVPTIHHPAGDYSAIQGDTVILNGVGYDNEDDILDDKRLTWKSDKDGLLGTGHYLEIDWLAPGKHYITLEVEDSNGSKTQIIIIIIIHKIDNALPSVNISFPVPDYTFQKGQRIVFKGSAYDAEDLELKGNRLQWWSSIDGYLGEGAYLIPSLSEGTHNITLMVTDSWGDVSTAVVTITVPETPQIIEGTPTAFIREPANSAEYQSGEMILFRGEAVDSEDGELSGTNLIWESNIDGRIGTGDQFSTDALSTGTHTISLTATDSDSLPGTALITIDIVNSLPTVSITSPNTGAIFDPEDSILFSGNAEDLEDGTLLGDALVWQSDIDGEIGSGETVSSNTLSIGTHTIRLTAMDGNGNTGFAEISFEIRSDAEIPVIFQDANLEKVIREAINKPTGDIYPSDLEGLTELDARQSNISDITGLEACVNLEELYLSQNQISNLSPLSELDSLLWLYLSYNNISDLTHISELTGLRRLYLIDNQISDIAPLERLIFLKELDLRENNITDISILKNMGAIEVLYLARNQITDVRDLENLNTLIWLYLSFNNISDISPIGKLTGLQRLYLNTVGIADIDVLQNLTSLKELDLKGNSITDISILKNMVTIEILYLASNQITDVSALENLNTLIWLYLSFNNISDISPIGNLTGLRRLYLNSVGIDDEDIGFIESLTSLNELDLRVNSVTDIRPLADNSGIGAGDTVYLNTNPLSTDSCNIYLPQLRDRGATVTLDATQCP